MIKCLFKVSHRAPKLKLYSMCVYNILYNSENFLYGTTVSYKVYSLSLDISAYHTPSASLGSLVLCDLLQIPEICCLPTDLYLNKNL